METGATITTIRRVLRGELGWAWPIFLLGCVLRQRALLAPTRWATSGAPAAEARYARRLALACHVAQVQPQGLADAHAGLAQQGEDQAVGGTLREGSNGLMR